MSPAAVALVIGSGSIKCAAAIGLQRCLQQEGIPIDLLVGCSGGAIYAALMALGHDPASATEQTTTMWTRDITAVPDRRAWCAWPFLGSSVSPNGSASSRMRS
jgi:NTE family protein